jgi:glyoxylase-like metal-dependent hydrolase (beta-lactamase superfamily II)
VALQVAELAPGLWRWTAPHPEWTPAEYEDEGWEQDVGAVYWEGQEAICLIDPIVPSDAEDRERLLAHLDKDVERAGLAVAVFLTVFWHERDAVTVAQRYDAEIFAPAPALERLSLEARGFEVGEPLPGGLEAFDVARRGEVVFVVPSEPEALVAGDVLLGATDGVRVCPDNWFLRKDGPAAARAALRQLADRPLGLLVVSHGEPVTENAPEALRRAVDS